MKQSVALVRAAKRLDEVNQYKRIVERAGELASLPQVQAVMND